jgi:rhodanese-related sulfurtransferase
LYNKRDIDSNELEVILQQRAEGKFDFVLIDVREPFEYNEAYIEGVDALKPTSQFSNWARDILENMQDKKLIFTCRTGNRSAQVQYILTRNGHKDCVNHIGGIVSYRGKITTPSDKDR